MPTAPADPFAGAAAHSPPPPSVYHSQPQDPYLPPAHSPSLTPPAHSDHDHDYLGAHYGGSTPMVPASILMASPAPSPYQSSHSVAFADDPADDFDAGDMPLLRRDNTRSTITSVQGDYQSVLPDDRSESNIRYGRIPQRVPRRNKTIKKVE